jgi:hypothetical protein
MTPQDMEQLRQNVLAQCYHQQETYQIDDTRYVLEKGNAASTERWTLWMYSERVTLDFVAGDSLEEVFEEAKKKGVPIQKLTLDQWHD